MSKKKKQPYEPHRPLPTKVSDSTAAEYNRADSKKVVEEELTDAERQEIADRRFFDEMLAEPLERILAEEDAERLYEMGFHIEMPEN